MFIYFPVKVLRKDSPPDKGQMNPVFTWPYCYCYCMIRTTCRRLCRRLMMYRKANATDDAACLVTPGSRRGLAASAQQQQHTRSGRSSAALHRRQREQRLPLPAVRWLLRGLPFALFWARGATRSDRQWSATPCCARGATRCSKITGS